MSSSSINRHADDETLRPYVVRPDGYEHPNAHSVGPGMFRQQLGEVLSGISRWSGEVSPDSIIIAEDEGKIAGLLFCSVNRDELVGNINSAFMDRDQRGQEIADLLLVDSRRRIPDGQRPLFWL